MAEESPRMKALRDYLVASPQDSERKWAEYVALASDPADFLNPKHGPAVVTPASPTTRSTATLRVLSSATPTDEFSLKRDNNMDDLSPGARRLSDLLVSGSASPTSATSPLAQSSASSTGRIPESAVATVALETPSPCSTLFLGDATTMSPTSAAAISASTSTCIPASATTPAAPSSRGVDFVLAPPAACSTDLAPESEAIYQLLMADQSVYEIQFAEYAEKYCESSRHRSGVLPARAPASVATPAAAVTTEQDLHSVMPTSCSTICLGADTSMKSTPSSQVMAPATSASTPASTAIISATADVSTVLQDPTELNAIHEVVIIDGTGLTAMTPMTCSPRCPRRDTSVLVPVLISSAAPISSIPDGDILPEITTSVMVNKVFNAAMTDIVPWPPPTCTAGTGLIQGHYLFHNAQQKRGKEFVMSCVLRSSLPPLVQDVQDIRRKQGAILLEVREDRHPFERIEVVKPKPPWLFPLGLFMNLSRSNDVLGRRSPTLIDVGLAQNYFHLEQLIMVKSAAIMYMLAYGATLRHHFSSGTVLVFSPAAPRSAMDFYSYPRLGMMVMYDVVLWPVFQSPTGKIKQLLPWDPWDRKIWLWNIRILFQWVTRYEFSALPWDNGDPLIGVHNCLFGFDFTATLYAQDIFDISLKQLQFQRANCSESSYLQFAIKCNLCSQAELPSNSKIELKPWPSWELLSCIAAVIRSLSGAFHSLPSSVLILILDAFFAKLHPLAVLNAGECYLVERLYSSCDHSLTVSAAYSELFPCASLREKRFRKCVKSCVDDTILNMCTCCYTCSRMNINILQVSMGSCMNGYSNLCGFELLHWEIAWWLGLECSASPTTVGYENCPKNGNTTFTTVSGRIVQAAAQGGIRTEAETYYYINPVQVHRDYIYDISLCYQHDPVHPPSQALQLPWDPDRLGGKPNFKRGGLSATCLHDLADGPPSWAMACFGDTEETVTHIYQGIDHNERRLGTERTASA